jgi:RNA polymerase sigma factor (sigma-70 family)
MLSVVARNEVEFRSKRVSRSPTLAALQRREHDSNNRASSACGRRNAPGRIGSRAMKPERSIVYVIDDDEAVRESVTDLLRSVGHDVQSFRSAQEFVESPRPDAPGCIVLDVRLPGQSGMEFQRRLAKSDTHLPVIFISAHGDIPMSVRAIKSGAIEFLTKPLDEQELLDAVQTGLARDRTQREEAKLAAEFHQRLEQLTPREREIMKLVVTGRLNKQIAAEVGLSEMTVKVHRSHVMQKMRASSLVDLVRMADKLGITKTAP